MLSDTAPEAERVQIELLRKATPARRVAMMRSLSAMAIGLARRALGRANPGLSREQIDLLFVQQNYGKELAESLRRYLNEHHHAAD
jgi:hypothetical protein